MPTRILKFINASSFSIHAFQEAMDAVTQHYYHYREAKAAHPSVERFLQYFYPYRDLDILDDDLDANAQSVLLNELQDVLSDFNEHLVSSGHQKRLCNLRRSERRNSTAITQYINDLFERYAKLLVVRVDVHFKEQVTLQEAQEEREYYLSSIRKEYHSLIGYIWKLEYGKDRGYHYHLAFFFDGNQVQGDIRLGQALGERWRLGSYYNCNADRQKYQEWGKDGIGEIRWDDTVKRQRLLGNALNYLLKMDEELLATMFERSRSIGKMELPSRRGNGGRPRRSIEA
ncbi:MAG: YagK/YfjJ domain-containing protein [Aeromonas sp.]